MSFLLCRDVTRGFVIVATYIFIVVWEHSVAQGVIVSPTDYPRLVVNYDFNYFSIHST